jgi:hypothetical protein
MGRSLQWRATRPNDHRNRQIIQKNTLVISGTPTRRTPRAGFGAAIQVPFDIGWRPAAYPSLHCAAKVEDRRREVPPDRIAENSGAITASILVSPTISIKGVEMRPSRLSFTERAAEHWCRLMHDKTTWPRNGTYRCLQCQRVFVVPWNGRERRPGFEHPVSGFEQFLVWLGL